MATTLKICEYCKKDYKAYECHLRGKHHFCSYECKGLWMRNNKNILDRLKKQGFQKGQKAWNWKTSKENIKGFSSMTWRAIARKIMGVQRNSGLIVHHIDKDLTNNNQNNLIIMTPNQHAKLHYKMGDTL